MAIIKLKNGFESGTSVALINWENGFPVITWIKNTGSCTYQDDPLVDEEIEVAGSHLVRYYAQHQADHVTIALVGTPPTFPAGFYISHTRIGVGMLEPILIKTWENWLTAIACGHVISQITSVDWQPIRFDWGDQETAAYYRLSPDTGEAELVSGVGEHTPYLDKGGGATMELKLIKPEPGCGAWPGKHIAYWMQMGHWSLEAWHDGRVRVWISCYRPGMTDSSHTHITTPCPHWARIVEWCESIWCHKMQPVDQAHCRQIAAEARDARRAWLKEVKHD